MLDRFIQNRQAVTHLSYQKGKIKFPTFSSDDWRILRRLRAVLKPMYETTIALQDRRTSLSSVIPTYKMLVRALTVCVPDELSYVREAIVKGLETRMVSDGLDGSGDKLGYADNKDLVLATLLDARYKAVYFDEDPLQEYKLSLVKEAEKVVHQVNFVKIRRICATHELFRTQSRAKRIRLAAKPATLIQTKTCGLNTSAMR